MDNETIQYDCFRGCTVTGGADGEDISCGYRAGCCKLSDRNWLKGMDDGTCPDIFEVRFKIPARASMSMIRSRSSAWVTW